MGRKNFTPQGKARTKSQVQQASRAQGAPSPRQHHVHRPAALNLDIYDDRSLSALLSVGQMVGSDVSGLAAAAAELRNRNRRARNRSAR